MNAEERLIDSLAQRLYQAHLTWQKDLGQSFLRSPWFMVETERKKLYLDAARVLEEGVS